MTTAKTLTEEPPTDKIFIAMNVYLLPEQKRWLEQQRTVTGEDQATVIRRLIREAMQSEQVAVAS